LHVVAATEALEYPRPELIRDAGAGVLNRDPQVPVALLGGDDDRRASVALSVASRLVMTRSRTSGSATIARSLGPSSRTVSGSSVLFESVSASTLRSTSGRGFSATAVASKRERSRSCSMSRVRQAPCS
jgi:hypothetical protein